MVGRGMHTNTLTCDEPPISLQVSSQLDNRVLGSLASLSTIPMSEDVFHSSTWELVIFSKKRQLLTKSVRDSSLCSIWVHYL